MFFIVAIFFGQGKINIFNYSQYGLVNTLVGSNPNANCYPSINGTNYPILVDPSAAVTYNGYYQSGYQTPPINQWTIYTANGGVSPTQHTSMILTSPIFATYTTWQMNKFHIKDSNGNWVMYGGNSIGNISCGGPFVDYVGPTPGNPVPYEAFWFVSNGETYFLIQ